MRRCLTLVLALLLFAGGCSSNRDGGPPDDASTGALTRDRTTVRWRGEVSALRTPLYGGDVEDLRLRAQVFSLNIDLGGGFWGDRPGSVHVAIRWNDPSELSHGFTGNAFSLYVLDGDGELVEEAQAVQGDPAAAQSLDAGQLADGRYEVLVVPNQTQGLAYEGVAFVGSARPDDLLPDLIPQPPTNVTFTATRAEGSDNTSCLEIERLGKPNLERCLRFDATIANVGSGPFIAEADITEAVEQRSRSIDAGLEPEGDLVQIVKEGDDLERRVTTGRWVIDREHVHTHLVDFAAFELYRVDGERGNEPLVTDAKIGFCPWDLVDERFGRAGGSVRVFGLPDCRVPSEREGSDPVVLRIGLSAGWADVYPAHRSIQYLDATDLADGVYDVVIRVDPNGWYEESDTSNNEEATRIRIEGDTITCVREPYGCPDNFSG
ncbi:MAG: lysyl oxidase family protein [Actinomycetota bacterium]